MLSKNLQACASKQHNFKYKELSRKVKNYAYDSMNFDPLSAECDKCDFGLIGYECQKLEFALKARHECRVRTRSLSEQVVWHMIYLFLHHHVHTSLIGRESVSCIFSIAALICGFGAKSLTD